MSTKYDSEQGRAICRHIVQHWQDAFKPTKRRGFRSFYSAVEERWVGRSAAINNCCGSKMLEKVAEIMGLPPDSRDCQRTRRLVRIYRANAVVAWADMMLTLPLCEKMPPSRRTIS